MAAMDKASFIGMGRNPDPDVRDIPLGFGAELAQNTAAHNSFAHLSDEQKNTLIAYVKGGASADDAKNRLATAIEELAKGNASFF